MRMKNRWIGGLLLAGLLAMAGCTPTPQGAGASGDASAAPASAEPMASEAPAESADDGGRYDY
jgi:hypothetical protein